MSGTRRTDTTGKMEEFWPSAGDNDALLFEDSDSISENSTNKSSDTSSVDPSLIPGRRRLCKVRNVAEMDMYRMAEKAAAEVLELPSDSDSQLTPSESGDLDDTLCNQLGTLSLNKSQAPTSVLGSRCSAESAHYGSAKSDLSNTSRAASVYQIDSDSDGGGISEEGSTSEEQIQPESVKVNISEDMVFSDGNKKYVLSSKIANILYDHQREGIKWLWNLHAKSMGGILGDDMGLGKTMQIAAFLAGLFQSRLMKRALVVAPKTLIAHWMKELTVVGLERKIRDYSGPSGNAREYALHAILQTGGVLLTTYDVVRHNCGALKGDNDDDENPTWDYLILDEGHLIKNPSTQRAKSLKSIPSAHRIIISGTPIQNNLREMWALYDFCCPDLLGDVKEFKAKYENLILSGNDKQASDRQKRIGSAVAQELRDRIEPFFLRRMKSEVFPDTGEATRQLANKNDIIVWLRLSKQQRQMYTAFLSSETAQRSLDGSALAALTVLKKICDHPLLLTKRATDDVVEGMESLGSDDAAAAEAMRASLVDLVNPEEEIRQSQNETSCKIVFLMSLLENLLEGKHRTLIFSQTLKMLDIIQEEIGKKGYSFRRIDGSSKALDRQCLVEEFQSDDRISIFLLTSQVGGLGLTLTGADRVVIVDPAWNPSKDNQSVDRAYRIGQVKDVVVYRLMTSGTLEEKIYRKQVFKGGLMKVATEKKDQFRYFSQQDLRELLTVPKSGFDISLTQQQLHAEHANQFKVSEKLTEHIKFLERQGIAGVSHHDLLFSKNAPDLPPATNDEVNSAWDSRILRPQVHRHQNSKLKHTEESRNEGSWKGSRRIDLVEDEGDENDVVKKRVVEDNITRLSAMLQNKKLVSKLPDGGVNITRKIKELEENLVL